MAPLPHRAARAGAEIIGHRGAPREALENTVASFERALELGADAIELDVHATADGVVVVHHDPVMAASAPPLIAGRAIAGLRWEEIGQAAHNGASPAPRLADVLDLVKGRATAYVEIKGSHIEEAVLTTIRTSGTECAVHAFDHRAVALVRALAPGMRTGILIEARLIDSVGALHDAAASDLWQQWTMIDRDLIESVHSVGARVIAWTVNDVKAAEEFLAMGIDGICTDVPGEMRRLVERR